MSMTFWLLQQKSIGIFVHFFVRQVKIANLITLKRLLHVRSINVSAFSTRRESMDAVCIMATIDGHHWPQFVLCVWRRTLKLHHPPRTSLLASAWPGVPCCVWRAVGVCGKRNETVFVFVVTVNICCNDPSGLVVLLITRFTVNRRPTPIWETLFRTEGHNPELVTVQ